MCWFGVYAAADKWLDGPDISKLTENYYNRNDGHRALLEHLIAVHDDHRVTQREGRREREPHRRLADDRHLRRGQPSCRSTDGARVSPCSPMKLPSRTKTTPTN